MRHGAELVGAAFEQHARMGSARDQRVQCFGDIGGQLPHHGRPVGADLNPRCVGQRRLHKSKQCTTGSRHTLGDIHPLVPVEDGFRRREPG